MLPRKSRPAKIEDAVKPSFQRATSLGPTSLQPAIEREFSETGLPLIRASRKAGGRG
jgi:hypothetical protein